MEKAIRLAEDLGIRIIQLAGYDVYYEESTFETKKRFLANLKKAADMAAKAGVTMGFETMENEFMNTVEKAMKYVTLVGSPYLNVYPDIGNITNAAKTYENDVLEDLELGKMCIRDRVYRGVYGICDKEDPRDPIDLMDSDHCIHIGDPVPRIYIERTTDLRDRYQSGVRAGCRYQTAKSLSLIHIS